MRAALLTALLLTACTSPAADDDDDASPGPTPTPVPGSIEALCAPIDVDLPIFDAHVHTRGESTEEDGLDWAKALLRDMNAHGIQRAVVLPPPFRDDPLEQEQVLATQSRWGELARRCDRVDPMVSAFDPRDPDAAAGVIEQLDGAPFAGLGALEFDDLSIDPAGGAMPALYAAVAERGLTVQFHARHADLAPERQEALLAVIRDWPEIPFVWFGFLDPGRWADAPDNLFAVRLPNEAMCGNCPAPSESPLRLVLGSDSPPEGYEAQVHLDWDTLGEAAEYARERLEAMPASEAAWLEANHEAAFPRRD